MLIELDGFRLLYPCAFIKCTARLPSGDGRGGGGRDVEPRLHGIAIDVGLLSIAIFLSLCFVPAGNLFRYNCGLYKFIYRIFILFKSRLFSFSLLILF